MASTVSLISCRVTGTVIRDNYRDYFWSPVLRTFRLLKNEGVSMADAFNQTLAGVEMEQTFDSRPPNHRSAVWLSGEWIRIKEGLSRLGRALKVFAKARG